MKKLEIGMVLNDHYEIVRLIGEGGMSVVYEGRDVTSGKPVALKVLKDEFSNTAEKIEKLKNEAEQVRHLRHPNIVKIYGLGSYEGHHYFPMELIDGLTLDSLIEQSIDWRDSCDIIMQVLNALNYTHAHGVIHKDIKPQNILVDVNKHVTLTDFGIAKNLRTNQTISATNNECSVHYISPEQARGGIVDEKSDIYSLGITFYEMLTGSVPFDGDTCFAIVEQHMRKKVIPACVVDTTIPRAISDVVVLATMRDTSKRFQTAGEMRSALKQAMENPDKPLLPDSFFIENELETHANSKVDPQPEETADDNTSENNEAGTEGSDETNSASNDNHISKSRVFDITMRVFVYLFAAFLVFLAGRFVVRYGNKYVDYARSEGAGVRYKVEDYSGKRADEVIEAFKNNGINYTINEVESDVYPAGYVLLQDAEIGSLIRHGDTIELGVITDLGTMIMPDFTGKSLKEARDAIDTQGVVIEVVELPGGTDKGTIMRHEPGEGGVIKKGDKVTFYTTKGSAGDRVQVPNLIGKSRSEAEKELRNCGLVPGNNYPKPGTELTRYYNPEADATPEITANVFDVTPVPTPEETIAPTELAETTNEMLPETAEITMEPTPTPTEEPTPEPTIKRVYASNRVLSQYPSPGAEVYKGAKVDLWFYDAAELDRISPKGTYYFDFPADKSYNNKVSLIKVDFVLENGETYSESFMARNKTADEFPLAIPVPYGWDSTTTKIYIYVNDTSEIYKMAVAKRTGA